MSKKNFFYDLTKKLFDKNVAKLKVSKFSTIFTKIKLRSVESSAGRDTAQWSPPFGHRGEDQREEARRFGHCGWTDGASVAVAPIHWRKTHLG
jgi:hypothetical protein